MRRREGEIIKRTVGSFESLLFVYFPGEQKIDTRAVAENINSVFPLLRQSRRNGRMWASSPTQGEQKMKDLASAENKILRDFLAEVSV